MRRAVRLLLVFAVLWCGLHLDEAAKARADWAYGAAAPASSDNSSDRGDEPENIAHIGHHHCPMAPDPRVTTPDDAAVKPVGLHFARPAMALHSLAQAPPLEPPTP
jgi:hypothetical protein